MVSKVDSTMNLLYEGPPSLYELKLRGKKLLVIHFFFFVREFNIKIKLLTTYI